MSNLLKHMSAMHTSVWNKSKANHEREEGVLSSSKSRTLDSFVKNMVFPAGWEGQLTDAIVDMVALDLHPGLLDCGGHWLSSLDAGSGTRLSCPFADFHFISAAEETPEYSVGLKN